MSKKVKIIKSFVESFRSAAVTAAFAAYADTPEYAAVDAAEAAARNTNAYKAWRFLLDNYTSLPLKAKVSNGNA